ncbi:MAG: hypothetical protein ACOCXQ_02515 [Patescibacteria group bacterium]
MKNKSKNEVDKNDVVQMFTDFQNQVLEKKPSFPDMCSDVRMMRFRVRPVHGDISELNFQNYAFIEALWSLGKLDQFFIETVDSLNKKERSVFFSLFDRLYQQYQSKLNHINLKSDRYDEEKTTNGFEVEIFRERFSKSN